MKINKIQPHNWVENLHARYCLGSRDLSHIFLGLISERTFRFRFLLRLVDQKKIHWNFFLVTCVSEKLLILRRQYNVHLESCFGVGNFNARFFWGGLKFQACVVFFWVCNMKLRQIPPS